MCKAMRDLNTEVLEFAAASSAAIAVVRAHALARGRAR
jgi:hypothetical protein